MGNHRLATPDLGRIFRGETVVGLSEWQLLERYREQRDEVAFEALVARHGAMVLGVCRRMLTNQTDVEDAFQATFLVLVRRARQVGPRDTIGPWLHGVATRVALRARSDAARQRRFQEITPAVTPVIDDRSAANQEIAEILDNELNRLPSKYRHPIVLCCLEGQTHEEAARQLKWPIGTVKGRLARARALLQSRLVRRGLTPAVGALSVALSSTASADPLHGLLDRTVKASLKLAVGHSTAQIASTSIASLVEGVLTSMFLNTLKWAGVSLLVGGLAFTGIGVMARQDRAAKKLEAPPALKTAADTPKPTPPAPTPLEEVAAPKAEAPDELATIRDLRRRLIMAAQREVNEAIKHFTTTNTGLEPAYQASKRLMDAEQALANGREEEVRLAKRHLERVREIARVQHSGPSPSEVESARVRAYAAEAELCFAQANETKRHREPKAAANSFDGRGKDPHSQLILAKLEEPISMSFNEDTPLEDVLKYIKQATTTQTYQGIPIYVDPLGLQEAEKSMTSTVRNMDLEGVPLRRTLHLLLKQIGLAYYVDDGLLFITSADSEDPLGSFGSAMAEQSPILQKAAKAERGELSLSEMKELVELLKLREQITKLSSGAQTEETRESQQNEELKQYRAEVNLLLKEVRGFLKILNEKKPTEKAAATR